MPYRHAPYTKRYHSLKKMKIILIVIAVIVGINLIPYSTKKSLKKLNQLILKFLIPVIIAFSVVFGMSIVGMKLKGIYGDKILGTTLILGALMYLATCKGIKEKIISNIILIPLLVIGIFNILLYNKTGTYKLNEELSIVTSKEGFLGCGEIMRITKTKFLIFDKELKYDSNQCLTGISNIKSVKLDDKFAEMLIFHDGKNDSENPYYYKIENNNEW